MQITVYVQCDARYNKYLLKRIKRKEIIGHTIDQVKKACKCSITSSIYNCAINKELIDYLKQRGDVEVIVSDEENVTKRFLDAVIDKNGYIVRVGGDQALLDSNMTADIIEKMFGGGYEFFYEESITNSILPDIVFTELLREKKEDVYRSERYFNPLIEADDVKRLNINVPFVAYKCRVSDYLGFVFARQVMENGMDIYKMSKTLSKRINERNSDLYSSGVLTSWMLGTSSQEFFYDIDGEINPWWCEAAANLVRERICKLKGTRVFEWGSGNSTLFWAKYADEVVSVEYDKVWCEKMKNYLPSNTKVNYCELVYGGDYCDAINQENGLFDIVLIDGRDRVRCAKNCTRKLKDDGVIVWDDTGREYYGEGIEFLKGEGFKQLELSGMMWGGLVKQYTSIFYKENNILEL